jgi:hypothetical protein
MRKVITLFWLLVFGLSVFPIKPALAQLDFSEKIEQAVAAVSTAVEEGQSKKVFLSEPQLGFEIEIKKQISEVVRLSLQSCRESLQEALKQINGDGSGLEFQTQFKVTTKTCLSVAVLGSQQWFNEFRENKKNYQVGYELSAVQMHRLSRSIKKALQVYKESLRKILIELGKDIKQVQSAIETMNQIENGLVERGLLQREESVLLFDGSRSNLDEDHVDQTNESCIACLSPSDEENPLVRMKNCTHAPSYCQSCLSQQFEVWKNHKEGLNQYQCMVMDCRKKPTLSDLRRYLSMDDIYNLRKRFLSNYESESQSFAFCRDSECEGIYVGNLDQHQFKCGTCRTKWCIQCGQKNPKGSDCRGHQADRDAQILRNLVDMDVAQKCPRCRRLIIRTSACEHIDCVCGKRFNYKGNYRDNNQGAWDNALKAAKSNID